MRSSPDSTPSAGRPTSVWLGRSHKKDAGPIGSQQARGGLGHLLEQRFHLAGFVPLAGDFQNRLQPTDAGMLVLGAANRFERAGQHGSQGFDRSQRIGAGPRQRAVQQAATRPWWHAEPAEPPPNCLRPPRSRDPARRPTVRSAAAGHARAWRSCSSGLSRSRPGRRNRHWWPASPAAARQREIRRRGFPGSIATEDRPQSPPALDGRGVAENWRGRWQKRAERPLHWEDRVRGAGCYQPGTIIVRYCDPIDNKSRPCESIRHQQPPAAAAVLLRRSAGYRLDRRGGPKSFRAAGLARRSADRTARPNRWAKGRRRLAGFPARFDLP